ncbi:hypothetical protein [uncultured Hymenobacter sp.]|uniref:hypothetical protein n=1 Tax=uncultured Hymenobacter sp. TaxID=170016 RepID=UPI0035CC2529
MLNRSERQSLVQRGLNINTRNQRDILNQLNVLYEELLASQEWKPEREQAALGPSLVPLSALEITRHLAGWPRPQMGAPRKCQQ